MYKTTPIKRDYIAEFLTPNTPIILWTNGGKLYQAFRDCTPSHVVAVVLDDDKATRKQFIDFAKKRIVKRVRYGVRLFVEGYTFKQSELEILNNGAIEVIYTRF